MRVNAKIRREVLGLFNVSEVARRLNLNVQKVHWALRVGKLMKPRILLGKRRYYRSTEIALLQKQIAKEQK